MATKDHYITLSQFRKLSGLPDAAIFWLMEKEALQLNVVKQQQGDGSKLMVNLASLSPELTMQALVESVSEPLSVASTNLAREISEKVDHFIADVVDQAVQRLQS